MSQAANAKSTLSVGGNDYQIYRLDSIKEGHVARLPYSLKVLLENLLRHADGDDVSAEDISAVPGISLALATRIVSALT